MTMEAGAASASPRFPVVCFPLALLLVGMACEQKTQEPAVDKAKAIAAEQVVAEQKAKDRAWQRMKECTEQSQRFVKEAGWVEGEKTGSITFMGFYNHYSAKHERCYILLSQMNGDANKDSAKPLFLDQMYDAFEGRLLAICTRATGVAKAKHFCTIQEQGDSPKFDCEACGQFIKDHMGQY